MVFALLAALTVNPAVQSPDRTDPPIRVSLNAGGDFERGDRAKVRLRLVEDGYVIVLRADVAGRVRVLFPLDPDDDSFVRGGRDYELPGRGGRETFFVDDRIGAGTVLAARSDDPFQFGRFTRGDHWDYRVLAGGSSTDDPEAGLLDIVSAMADSARFDYDVVGYSVDGAERYTYRRYGYHPSFHFGFGYYYGARYRCGYYDPFYDPFFCDPFYYDPIYYDRVYYRPYRYSCWSDPFCWGYGRHYGYAPARTVSRLTFKRPTPPPPFVLPRDRFPRTPASAGERTPVVTTGREAARRRDAAPRPDVTPQRDVAPRRDVSPRTVTRPKSSEGSRRTASQPRASSPRPSTPAKSSGSRPSNSGTRRH